MIFAKDCIHNHFQVVAGGRVAVQIDAACWFEQPLHFKQPNAHHDEIGLHRLAVALAGGVNDGVEAGVIICDLAMPGEVYIMERPSVLEGCTGGL